MGLRNRRRLEARHDVRRGADPRRTPHRVVFFAVVVGLREMFSGDCVQGVIAFDVGCVQ